MSIHPVVELLLSRMDSHPEEFHIGKRWFMLLHTYDQYFNAGEKAALTEKQRVLALNVMHEKVQKELLDPAKPEPAADSTFSGYNQLIAQRGLLGAGYGVAGPYGQGIGTCDTTTTSDSTSLLSAIKKYIP